MIRRFGPSALAFALITIAVHGFCVSRGDPHVLSTVEATLVRGGQVPCYGPDTPGTCPPVDNIPCINNICEADNLGDFTCDVDLSPLNANSSSINKCVQVTNGSGGYDRTYGTIYCKANRRCDQGNDCILVLGQMVCAARDNGTTYTDGRQSCQATGVSCDAYIAQGGRDDASLLASSKGESYPFN